jgi:hypothetical protein
MEVVYFAIHSAAKKQSMPIRNWKGALNRFIIELPERMLETMPPEKLFSHHEFAIFLPTIFPKEPYFASTL